MDKIFIELDNIKQKQNSSDDDYITLPKYGTIDTPDFIALNTPPKGPRPFFMSSVIEILSESKNLIGSFVTIRISL